MSAVDGPVPVLEVADLHTEFHLRHANVKAVDGISFSVRRGECLGLVGESGCGKTTAGLSVMKLLPNVGHITGGTVRLNGRELVSLDEDGMRQVRGNEVAMIFQDPMTSLNPTWTIGRQIAEPVRLHKGTSKKQALERAAEVLRLVGMPRPEERLRQYPHQLSGGLRQRVMIAIALSCEPSLLIADEPTTALDVTIQAQILDLIDELRQRLHMAVLLITHDMGVIAARADRVMVMYAGRVVEGGGTTELFDTMRHPYAEALFESIPRLDQNRNERLYSIPGVPPDLSRKLVGCRFVSRCRYATDRCAEQEPLLATGTGQYEGRGESPNPGTRLPPPGSDLDSHVFACHHPVAATRAERLAAQLREGEPALAAASELGAARPVGEALDLARDDLGLAQTPTVASVRLAAQPSGPDRASHLQLTERGVVLQLDQLDKQFPVTAGAIARRVVGTIKAVSQVTFSVHRGETFGLVGESGCGKTTIGRLVVGLERPTSGAVRFEGVDFSALRGRRLRERRREMQLMFQDPYSSLDPRMRVRSIVGEPLVIQQVGSRQDQRPACLGSAGRGRAVAQGRRSLPSRVLRRPAPAHRPRTRPGPAPQAHRGR